MSYTLPEVEDIEYDAATDTFRNTRTGQSYTDGSLRSLAESKGGRDAHAGITTLKRAALANTVLQKSDGGKRSQKWGDIFASLADGLTSAPRNLKGIFYSKQTNLFDEDSWETLSPHAGEIQMKTTLIFISAMLLATLTGCAATLTPQQLAQQRAQEAARLAKMATGIDIVRLCLVAHKETTGYAPAVKSAAVNEINRRQEPCKNHHAAVKALYQAEVAKYKAAALAKQQAAAESAEATRNFWSTLNAIAGGYNAATSPSSTEAYQPYEYKSKAKPRELNCKSVYRAAPDLRSVPNALGSDPGTVTTICE